jgi:hypothetical protein
MADEQWTLDQGVRSAEERTRLQVGNDLNVNYDHAKKVLNLAGRTGLPWEIIDENPDAVEEAVAKEDFDPDRWMKESPEFAKFAADNPMHLAVLKQDEDNLTWFEREWKRPLKLSTASTIAQVRLNQLQARRRSGRENWLEGDEAEIERLEDQIQTHNFGASGTFRPIIWAAKQLGPMAYTAASGLDEAAAGAMVGYGAGIATRRRYAWTRWLRHWWQRWLHGWIGRGVIRDDVRRAIRSIHRCRLYARGGCQGLWRHWRDLRGA